jgi:methionyl-tRNA formyltransferase
MIDYDFGMLLNHYLPNNKFDVVITESMPDDPLNYYLIAPFNYRKIIKTAASIGNIIVFHASELPDGRGWAPLYYTFSSQKNEYILTGILADDEVDTGDIIIRCRFAIKLEYTASFLRKLDQELSLLLISKILTMWPNQKPNGIKQVGTGISNARRYPNDNEVDIDRPLRELIPHLRGVEPQHPAFFHMNGVKYLIEIKPESTPKKPNHVTIEYPARKKFELWNDWHDS